MWTDETVHFSVQFDTDSRLHASFKPSVLGEIPTDAKILASTYTQFTEAVSCAIFYTLSCENSPGAAGSDATNISPRQQKTCSVQKHFSIDQFVPKKKKRKEISLPDHIVSQLMFF